MNLDNLNKWLALAANLGVIAGILLLAMELNQNNKLMRAEADYNYMQVRAGSRERIAYDPAFAEFMLKSDLSNDVDMRRFRSFFELNLLSLEWEYRQMRNGTLGSPELIVQKWRSDFRDLYTNPAVPRNAAVLDVYASFRASLSPEFVQFWEREIIGAE